VCQDFKTLVENNAKLKLEFGSDNRRFDPRRRIRIYSSKICKGNSRTNNISLSDLRGFQLSDCIKEVSLDFYDNHKQNADEIRKFASILNRQTDLVICSSIGKTTPEPTSFLTQGANLAEQFPIFRLVSFEIEVERPYPEFTKGLIIYYLKNSDSLQKLKLGSTDILTTLLESAVQTGLIWASLKEFNLHITRPQGISGGIADTAMPFCSDALNTFSNPIIAQRMPSLSKLEVSSFECVNNFNGLANFVNLTSLSLWLTVEGLSQEECSSIFNPKYFRQKVNTVQNLELELNSYNFPYLTKGFDFIFQQFPAVRHLDISLDGEADQIYLIAAIQDNTLSHLESLRISSSRESSHDDQIAVLLCSDSLHMFCPKLTKLSLLVSTKSTLSVIRKCSVSIKQVEFRTLSGFIKGRMGLKHIINSLDFNKRIENIIFSINSASWCEPFVVEALLKNYSEKFRLEKRNRDKGGTCLIKCRNGDLSGSLIWETKETKKTREFRLDPIHI
jgi:hypothetical protein